MAGSHYDARDITILEGLEAVRLRPGMYIGSTGPKGLHHILWEIVDNAVDEAANGYADRIDVRIYKDGSVSVEDNVDAMTWAVSRGIINGTSANTLSPKSPLTRAELAVILSRFLKYGK